MPKKRTSWLSLLVARFADPFRRDGSSWLIVAALFVAAPLALLAAYQQWGGIVLNDQKYHVAAEQLGVTPPQPTWIYGNVKAEVIRDGSLEELSTLDETLTPRMIDAFELHPWVETVVSLRKEHPNHVHVHLRYRRPVAMVEVPDRDQRWISPVDRHGFVLPTDGFVNKLDSPDNYLRIYIGRKLAPGVAGTLWPDVRIRHGAALAGYLGDSWKKLKLHRVVALPASEEFRSPQFALAMRNRAPIVWGSAPGQEEDGEQAAQAKLAVLAGYIRENGSLDSIPANHLLDLRREGLVLVEPRTARRE